MGQTAIFQLPYPELTDPADVPTDVRELAEAVETKLGAALATSLPGSPVDGQEIYYQNAAMATAGVVWHLRYRAGAAGSYKWEVVGGPPLFSEIVATENTTSTTFVALTTPGPQITLPLAGDYIVALGARIGYSGALTAIMSYQIGATGAVDDDGVNPGFGATAGYTAITEKERLKTGISGILSARYRTTAAQASFGFRWMRVTPIRVG